MIRIFVGVCLVAGGLANAVPAPAAFAMVRKDYIEDHMVGQGSETLKVQAKFRDLNYSATLKILLGIDRLRMRHFRYLANDCDAIKVLRVIVAYDYLYEPLDMTRLSIATGLPWTTIHRKLDRLTDLKLVEKKRAGRRVFMRPTQLAIDRVQPYLDEVVDLLQEHPTCPKKDTMKVA